MFNSLIHPRNPAKVFSDALLSLFCHEGIVEPGESFHPNHFVPLVFLIPANLKESVSVQLDQYYVNVKSTLFNYFKILIRMRS